MPHWDIGAELGILDLERAVKIAGSMFAMYRGRGARLLRALVQLALDRNADAYEEIRPPTLVRTDTMVSTGHLPKFADDAYHIERDDLWAIPTAEVPLTSLHRDEILDEADLPAAATGLHAVLPPRGRLGRARHPGPAARSTSSTRSSSSPSPPTPSRRHRLPGGHAAPGPRRSLARPRPRLPGRSTSAPATSGSSAARTLDIEVYAPGCDQWLEVSSVSWFSDYQARRANIRYRPTAGRQGHRGRATRVNGSALGWPRTVAAYLETHRQPDGSVAVVERAAALPGRRRRRSARG